MGRTAGTLCAPPLGGGGDRLSTLEVKRGLLCTPIARSASQAHRPVSHSASEILLWAFTASMCPTCRPSMSPKSRRSLVLRGCPTNPAPNDELITDNLPPYRPGRPLHELVAHEFENSVQFSFLLLVNLIHRAPSPMARRVERVDWQARMRSFRAAATSNPLLCSQCCPTVQNLERLPPS